MKQIVVVGDKEFSLGFSLIGIKKIIDIDTDVNKIFKELLGDSTVGLIITHPAVLQKLSAEIHEKVQVSASPAVLALSEEGDDQNIRNMIIKAIGVDLWNK